MRSSLYAIPLLFLTAIILLLAAITTGRMLDHPHDGGHQVVPPIVSGELKRYTSGDDLLAAFAASRGPYYGGYDDLFQTAGTWGVTLNSATPMPVPAPTLKGAAEGYSTTNVQVAGVDEADVVKTDGQYIYLIAGGKLTIVQAMPASNASIVGTISFGNKTPEEMFIDGDRLLVFSVSNVGIRPLPVDIFSIASEAVYPSWYSTPTTTVELYDMTVRSSPRLMKSFELEGDYLTSRLIGDDAYFVVNSNPGAYAYQNWTNATDIIPLCKEASGDIVPIAAPTDIGYIPGIQASSFITIGSISLADEGRNVTTQTIAGSGQSVYASQDNLYIAESCYQPYYYDTAGGAPVENTTVLKFALNGGDIASAGAGNVKGHILNQFSMDEYGGYFRIATTLGQVWDTEHPARNNVYVLDGAMRTVGALEDLAPGEKIYSSLFMGDRCYLVTFKKTDPLFVIDMSNATGPRVLGKLKIPGYSDYLYPYDDTHLIGIGKDAVDAEPELVASRGLDFAWYQGVKMAIFDVSDVENPQELCQVVIGDRGTDSPVLTDHRAFLFDKEKGLLVLPITVAEIEGEPTSPYQYGDYVFQGAYVYDVSLQSGFTLRGKVTQYDDDSVFMKSGYYFYGDRSITRSLYIGDVLYTLSSTRLQMNDLATLDRINAIDIGASPTPVPAFGI